MRRLISDANLDRLRARADAQEGEYWRDVSAFLLGLKGKSQVSKREHNWLSEIRHRLAQPWD